LLVSGLLWLVLAGTILLMLPVSSAGRPLRPDEALFTAVSAVATTGLTVIIPGEDLSVFGQLVLLVLMQLGGVGFMVVAVLAFRLIGRRVTFAERLALRDSLGVVSAGAILRLAYQILLGVVAIELAGALVLWLNWRPIFGTGRAAYLAIFHAVSAVTNASFDLFGGSQPAGVQFPTDALTLLTLAALIFLGGIGIPVIGDLYAYRKRRRLTLHTRIVLTTSLVLIVVGTLAFFSGEQRFHSVFDDRAPRLLLISFFHSVASRTAGFTITTTFGRLAPASAFVLMMLMFIGASPASMGGGITTTAFAVLMLTLWNFARGREEIVVGRRVIPRGLLYKTTAVISGASLLIAVVTWLLLLTQENISLAQALVETISAFSTTGYSLGLTPRLDTFGRLLIAALMFFGRLGTLTIIIALARPHVDATVQYPEENILLG